ncbi:GNAT family N-acetyltransferase [Streptococcus ruminicola]|uniref:GNAT family N-acetyltransferase n=1 Tax=Streptococcus ruminicola TaxID=2686210 RepID=A0AAE6R466_9STRE|nr:GNAT family N-acetyltransferase [Streptococcus ruminicola]QGZ26922.1 GNAT family N-acetyltransferase [Streptococcus ruminicola]
MEIRPIDFCDEEAYRSFLASFKNDDNPFVAPETTREVTDFKAFVENSRAQETQTTNPDYSTVTKYYAFVNGTIAARIACRWQLEKGNLATIGGHIGYQTAPAFRRQGIMTKLLNFALEEYGKRGISPVLITAREDNVASRKTIENAGGVLENIIDLEDGHRLARYWIRLEK